MTGRSLRAKRAAAGIPGHAVCRVAKMSRAKLSDIERENVAATPEQIQRLDAAIDQIVQTKRHVERLAKAAGLSLIGTQL
jgi:hypothetical protein